MCLASFRTPFGDNRIPFPFQTEHMTSWPSTNGLSAQAGCLNGLSGRIVDIFVMNTPVAPTSAACCQGRISAHEVLIRTFFHSAARVSKLRREPLSEERRDSCDFFISPRSGCFHPCRLDSICSSGPKFLPPRHISQWDLVPMSSVGCYCWIV